MVSPSIDNFLAFFAMDAGSSTGTPGDRVVGVAASAIVASEAGRAAGQQGTGPAAGACEGQPFELCKTFTSSAVKALPPIPQSPLATSFTRTQVTPRKASPSIPTIVSVTFSIMSFF